MNKKQKLLIEYLLSSPDTFTICHSIIKPDYFDPELRNTVEFIFNYYEDYSNTPSIKQIEAEQDITFEKYDILKKDEIEYCAIEIETFCKQRAMESATLSLVDLIQDKNYGEAERVIKEAASISLTKNLGIRYFDTVKERLQSGLTTNKPIATGWAELDAALYGGPGRGELLLMSANSGGGKSVTLANLGFNCVNNGLNVLYVSLELNEFTIGQRFDTMYTGISRDGWENHISEIETLVLKEKDNNGIMDIVQMDAGTTSLQIRSFLKEYQLHHGFTPDVLIVDYLDEMAPNEKVSADNVWEKDKRCASQLRQIGVDHNMLVATASQLNRSAVKATANEHNHSQIAGGISKINIADVYWSIIMTTDMMIAGEIVFILQKTRNSDGVGKQFHLKWDGKRLRILDQQQAGLNFVKKEPAPEQKNNISNLFEE